MRKCVKASYKNHIVSHLYVAEAEVGKMELVRNCAAGRSESARAMARRVAGSATNEDGSVEADEVARVIGSGIVKSRRR